MPGKAGKAGRRGQPASSEVDMATSTATILSLPTDSLQNVLLQGCLHSIGLTARTCKSCRSAVMDIGLWNTLLEDVWKVQGPVQEPRKEFLRRFHLHHRLNLMQVENGGLLLPDEDEPWLVETMGSKWYNNPNFARFAGIQHVWCFDMQCLTYEGSADEAEALDTVGVACLPVALDPWPVGHGGQVCYFEVDVLDGGMHRYIAVGWCREQYPQECKQPGWGRCSYGYHGDDGRAYSGSGFGKRFGPTFGSGQVVGTGLVMRAGEAYIFYTLDGELVGTPFKKVPRPELLRPCVGLHSPREKVRLNFGLGKRSVLHFAPPRPPAPFAFDLNTFAAALPPPTAPLATAADTAASPLEGSSGDDEDEDEEAEGAGHLQEIRALVEADEDVSEETLEELRYYLRTRGLSENSFLSPLWGASSVNELAPMALRALCAQVLQAEDDEEDDEDDEEDEGEEEEDYMEQV